MATALIGEAAAATVSITDAAGVWAVRRQLPVTPEVLYPRLAEAVLDGRWEAARSALAALAPLIGDTDQRLGRGLAGAIAEAIAAGDRTVAMLQLKRSMAANVRVLLAAAPHGGSPPRRKQMVRRAYAEFLALDPYLRASGDRRMWELTTQVRRGFMYAFGVSDRPEPFASSCAAIGDLLMTSVEHLQ